MQVQIYPKDKFLELMSDFRIEQFLNKKPVYLQGDQENHKFNA